MWPPRASRRCMLGEYPTVDEIVKQDQDWLAAMKRRGFDDVSLVCVCPLSAGNYDRPGESGRRLLRCLSFTRDRVTDAPWAHPIDGLVAYVDLIARRVVEVVDDRILPVPAEHGNYTPDVIGTMRDTLRPIEITQPDGPSFTVTGDLVEWQNWSFRVGFDVREGLVLHLLSYRDGERDRPVLYRASVAEMVVPYGDPSPVRFWQNYFDIGEYSLGKQVNALKRGCDCLGEIHYFDAVLADDNGDPQVYPNAICLHEEDHGVLWKHSDLFTGSDETRRQRRLVISFFATVGNYDYGFYWYLYLDGTIQLENKATGVIFTSAHPGGDYPWATEVAPGLGAPHHQHLFCARLDMTIDGVPNAVDEVEVQRVPVGPDNPYGNAIGRKDHPPPLGIRRRSPRGQLRRPHLAGPQPDVRQPPRRAGVLRAVSPGPAAVAGRPVVVGGPQGGIRHQAPVGHPVRPRPTLPGRRTGQPTPWRRRLAAMAGAGPGHRRPGHRGVARLRPHPLPTPRGLADHAGRHVRLHPETVRFLRPQPHPGRAIIRPALPLMPAAPFTSDELARVLLPFGESCMLPARPIPIRMCWLGSGGICSRVAGVVLGGWMSCSPVA